MDFYQHLIISSFIGICSALLLGTGLTSCILLFSAAILTGVFVDIDHFLIDYLRTGKFGFLKCMVINFPKSLLDSDICSEYYFPNWQRYLTHSLVLLSLILIGLAFNYVIIQVGQLSLAVHIVCDIYYDNVV